MRTILIVLDSVGIGELPDADKYGDKGSNTLMNIKKSVPQMNLENLIKLGLSNIDGNSQLSEIKINEPTCCFGKLAEQSAGKDTTIGHWEISGVLVEKPLPTYPNGFPDEIIKEFENKINRKIIGNYPSSGTEILLQLGEEHVRTGNIIVYTSADSVFQIAAHENIVPVDELYNICQIARDLLVGDHAVSRVIARPFIGSCGNYTRTRNRKDFSLEPPSKTMLDYIFEAGQTVAAVGKIEDIFAGKGITQSVHTINNSDGVDKTIEYMKTVDTGLIFTNLVDFDMIYGHRNDYMGYAKALVEFDDRLPEIISNLLEDDLLLITADHGCDPTTESTDHSREYIPVLAYGSTIKSGVNIGTRNTFSDIAATILDYQKVTGTINGKSFLDLISKEKEN